MSTHDAGTRIVRRKDLPSGPLWGKALFRPKTGHFARANDGAQPSNQLDVSVSPEFLYNFLVAYRRHSAEQAVGATFQNLKTDQIREWVVPVPPENLQTRFQQIAREFRGLLAQQSTATAKAQATFDALLAGVFSG